MYLLINYMQAIRKNLHNNAINVSSNIKIQIIEGNLLPPHCTLEPTENTYIIICFTHPNCNTVGYVIFGEPKYFLADNDAEGFVHMFCAIDSYDGYMNKLTVNSMEELMDVIVFCQSLLQYQPNVQHLDFIRVPQYMLNHRAVPNHLRLRNLEEIENKNENQQ